MESGGCVMFKVNCLNPISNYGMDLLGDNYEVIDIAAEAQAVLVRSASMHEMEFSDELLAAYIDGNTTENENVFIEQHVETEELDTIFETKEDYQSFEDYISVWDGDYGFWELGLPPVLTHDGEINIIHDDEIDKLSEYDESIM